METRHAPNDGRQLVVAQIGSAAKFTGDRGSRGEWPPKAAIKQAVGRQGAGGCGPPLIVHEPSEHLDRSRTMGAREFGDGLVQLRPAARVGGPQKLGPRRAALIISGGRGSARYDSARGDRGFRGIAVHSVSCLPRVSGRNRRAMRQSP